MPRLPRWPSSPHVPCVLRSRSGVHRVVVARMYASSCSLMPNPEPPPSALGLVAAASDPAPAWVPLSWAHRLVEMMANIRDILIEDLGNASR